MVDSGKRERAVMSAVRLAISVIGAIVAREKIDKREALQALADAFADLDSVMTESDRLHQQEGGQTQG